MQFVLKPATVSQKKFHEVDEVYSLTTLLPNPRRATLSLCHLILPEVIGWPTKKFLTFKGVLLKQPNEWYTPKAVAYTDANYDFGAKSPVRPLRPHNR